MMELTEILQFWDLALRDLATCSTVLKYLCRLLKSE
jgi:hypothetical protein